MIIMSYISDLLEVSTGSVIAVVGCGGKSSLIELIAKHNIEKKVLITATTKIFPIVSNDVILCDTIKSSVTHKPQTGIQCLGQLNRRNGKLESLPDSVLLKMINSYDIVLLEADGSRWLPCKGWRDNEPVVPGYCTHTVGVVTMNALGKAATNDIVHRLPEFLSLTGLRAGDIITEKALVDMVCLQDGMFKGSKGKQYLLVNRVEDDKNIHAAESFLQFIKTKYPDRFRKLIYGSVHRNDWQKV